MSNDYLKSFYELSYTHDELEALLKKISNGDLLTKEQYKLLIAIIDTMQNLADFNGTYDSLPDKPDIVEVIKESNIFVTYEAFDVRSKTMLALLEDLLKELIADSLRELDEKKADKDHLHDDRYSLLDHDHDDKYSQLGHAHDDKYSQLGHLHDDKYSQLDHNHDDEYIAKGEMTNLVTKNYLDSTVEQLNSDYDSKYVAKKETEQFVTKEYLDIIIEQLEGNIGSGGAVVIYKKPSLSVTSSSLFIKHKEPRMITIRPIFMQNDAGSIKNVTIKKDGVVVYESTELKNYEDTITLNHQEKAVYEVTVQYSDGAIKKDPSGNPYPDNIKAGSLTQKVTIQGIANSYYGVIGDKSFEISDIETFTSIENSTKGYTVTYILDDQKSVYMYPKSFGDLTSIKDVNNFDYINSYTLSTITFEEIVYNVYVLTDITSMEVGFKQVFS